MFDDSGAWNSRTGIDLDAFDAVFLDMDGTILDLEFRDPDLLDVRSDLETLFAHYGIEMSFSPLLASLESALATLEGQVDPETHDEVARTAYRRIAIEDVHAARYGAVRRHASDLLETVSRAGLPIVVVTNNSRIGSKIALEESGLPLPDGLVTRDDVARAKPEPDMTERALEIVGDVNAILVIGDSVSDATSAKMATERKDVQTVTVLLGDDGEASRHVDVRVDDLATLLAEIE